MRIRPGNGGQANEKRLGVNVDRHPFVVEYFHVPRGMTKPVISSSRYDEYDNWVQENCGMATVGITKAGFDLEDDAILFVTRFFNAHPDT